jgi:phosphotriesterase-related protein
VADAAPGRTIQTVLGSIDVGALGPTLAHEHVMCDFGGASVTGRHRWHVDEVVRVMQPYLRRLGERGFTGFVDCTPAYLGRDPRVLTRLSERTGLHILTNTGYYGGAGDRFVPSHAYRESADQLADRWVREWTEGIEDTGVRPGFMKIGVDEAEGNPARLPAIDARIVAAAARASHRTGLAVVCHTGDGPGGLAAANLFVAEGGAPDRFIVAHSDEHGLDINRQIARLGAWVSFDAIGRKPLDMHFTLVTAMLEPFAERLLLSQDSGWFEVSESGGGTIREYTDLPDAFLPALRARGVPEKTVRQLVTGNPAAAFAISEPE